MQNVLNYFISTNVPTETFLVWVGLTGSLTLLVLGLCLPLYIARLQKNKTHLRDICRKLANLFRIAGTAWFILFFFRYQNIPWFVTRGWSYLLLVIFLGYNLWLWLEYRRRKPDLKKVSVLENSYEKYLPKKKAAR